MSKRIRIGLLSISLMTALGLPQKKEKPKKKPDREPDSLVVPKDVIVVRDSVIADSAVVVRKSFNHKEQVIVGSVIMASLALILVTMNNYNPR